MILSRQVTRDPALPLSASPVSVTATECVATECVDHLEKSLNASLTAACLNAASRAASKASPTTSRRDSRAASKASSTTSPRARTCRWTPRPLDESSRLLRLDQSKLAAPTATVLTPRRLVPASGAVSCGLAIVPAASAAPTAVPPRRLADEVKNVPPAADEVFEELRQCPASSPQNLPGAGEALRQKSSSPARQQQEPTPTSLPTTSPPNRSRNKVLASLAASGSRANRESWGGGGGHVPSVYAKRLAAASPWSAAQERRLAAASPWSAAQERRRAVLGGAREGCGGPAPATGDHLLLPKNRPIGHFETQFIAKHGAKLGMMSPPTSPEPTSPERLLLQKLMTRKVSPNKQSQLVTSLQSGSGGKSGVPKNSSSSGGTKKSPLWETSAASSSSSAASGSASAFDHARIGGTTTADEPPTLPTPLTRESAERQRLLLKTRGGGSPPPSPKMRLRDNLNEDDVVGRGGRGGEEQALERSVDGVVSLSDVEWGSNPTSSPEAGTQEAEAGTQEARTQEAPQERDGRGLHGTEGTSEGMVEPETGKRRRWSWSYCIRTTRDRELFIFENVPAVF